MFSDMWFGIFPRLRHPFLRGVPLTPAAKARVTNASLYGTFLELVRAADAGAQVRRAIFVTHRQDDPLLSEEDRDLLWDLFEVPVYAIVLDRHRRILAYECEIHNGLHVTVKFPVAGDQGAICECGSHGAKLFLQTREPARVA